MQGNARAAGKRPNDLHGKSRGNRSELARESSTGVALATKIGARERGQTAEGACVSTVAAATVFGSIMELGRQEHGLQDNGIARKLKSVRHDRIRDSRIWARETPGQKLDGSEGKNETS